MRQDCSTVTPPVSAAGATVLVVDDDATNRDLLGRGLAHHGYAVRTAADAGEALAVLRAESCDAVLLDVMMPGQSGLDLLSAIRGDARLRRLPVIMVTARGDRRDVIEALDRGANDYVTKPIDVAVTLARVRAHLGRATAERAALALQRRDDLQHAQKLSVVGRLSAGVAHDLNNLLMAIRGYGEFLRDDLEAGDPRRRHADQVLKAATSASGLTRQLLAVARGAPAAAPSLVDVGAVVRGIMHLLGGVLGDHIDRVVDVPEGLWPVVGEAGQLEQVLLNLVVNAADAMPDGGRLYVALANVPAADGESGGEGVALTVTDSGCGMSADTAARIFEPFFTTKAGTDGMGLGLAMVRAIVEDSGGTVGVTTALGAGASFRVVLPRGVAPWPRRSDSGAAFDRPALDAGQGPSRAADCRE